MRAHDEHILRGVKLLQMADTPRRGLDVIRNARPVLVHTDAVERLRAVLGRVGMDALEDAAGARGRRLMIIMIIVRVRDDLLW